MSLVCLSPLVVVVITETTKYLDRKEMADEFENRRFMFETKLGCYSPK